MCGGRYVILVVLFVIVVDFSWPMAPGAFQLDPDDSLDCARTETILRMAPAAVAITTSTARPTQPRVLARVRRPPAPVVNHRPDVTRDRVMAPSAPQSSSEDH